MTSRITISRQGKNEEGEIMRPLMTITIHTPYVTDLRYHTRETRSYYYLHIREVRQVGEVERKKKRDRESFGEGRGSLDRRVRAFGDEITR